MLSDQIMRASLNDLIFEGRNKSYGAYMLRKIYERHLLRAMLMAFSGFLFALFLPRIIQHFSPPVEISPPAVLKDPIVLPPPPIFEEREQPKATASSSSQATTQVLTTPEIVVDHRVTVEVPSTDLLRNSGNVVGSPVEGPVEVPGPPQTGVADPGNAAAPTDDEVHNVVEETPVYPGGMNAMLNFISKNVRYPEAARQAGVDGKVFVSFVLNKEGEVTKVQIERGLGFGLDEEAARVVKLLKGFTPARQAGRPVNYRYVLPIRFRLN